MATSAKRKQEETHLKMLREMTSLAANRKCFDCDQRGPTYVNMTVGSFVCTTCSGILRGLNPPHRVKSISMTTFTQQEIDFLQKHGNEVCKHIWLGLYDDRTSVVPDFREPQKVKEFLQEKYEKKRWYVPPDQARAVASVQASVSGSSASSTGSTPEVQPLKTLQLNKTPLRQSPGLSRSQAHSAAQEKKFDLLSDLGGDIFAAPPTQTAPSTNFANFAHFPSQSGESLFGCGRVKRTPLLFFHYPVRLAAAVFISTFLLHVMVSPHMAAAPQGNSNTNFANFEAFGNTTISSHLSTSPPSKSFSSGGGVPIPSASSAVPAQSQTAKCTEDRYAALAELDNELSSSVTTGSNVPGAIFGPVLGSSPAQNQPVMASMPPGFGAVPSTNPFVAAAIATDMASNPFQTNGRGPAAGPAFPVYGQNKPSITPFGQPMAVPGMSNNPFMAGAPAGPFPSGGSSTNPFL
ncbi:arf-GAP domain and FG repeat-containing protein 1b isoform X3 [Fundulus heteroclitus]|uniref:arf-GAP domain and FG repeat-containing protein 1b isoform X3 n=1 Tax=Fundulus heteroclitus TaxID=8078 RepID=UPI00165C50D8|nr:arf-GAP domain and FG repeat-containing protein 1b isoform X3 [Fundulus heteroclitus]